MPELLAVAIFAVSVHPIHHAADVKPYASDLLMALALLTPATDGRLISDTNAANAQLDIVLKPDAMAEFWAVYAGGNDRADPYLSPVYGDFSKGFPPTLLQSGTRDLLLSDTVRMHRALRSAGVDAQLHVWEAMPHGGFGGAPEDQEMRIEFAHFLSKHAGWAKP